MLPSAEFSHGAANAIPFSATWQAPDPAVKVTRTRQARTEVVNPYRDGASTVAASSTTMTGIMRAIIAAGFFVLCSLVGVIYVSMRDDMKEKRADAKELGRDVTEIRVGVSKISGQLDQILQRLPRPPGNNR
jgi:hypothetical protein